MVDNAKSLDGSGLALRALAFLAGNDHRVAWFLGATGISPDEIADRLNEQGFQIAVLDFLLQNEPLLLEFAKSEDVAPEQIWPARDRLAGEHSQHGG